MQLLISRPEKALQVDFSDFTSPVDQHQRSKYASLVFLMASLFFSATSTLTAAQKNDLEISLVSQRVEKDGAKEILVNDTLADPGDVIQYTASFRNTTLVALNNLAPTLPIPSGTEYVAESASPAPFEASLDGKTFQRWPIRQSRTLADGSVIYVEVPMRKIRILRWRSGDLPGRTTFTASARVRVTTNPTALAQD